MLSRLEQAMLKCGQRFGFLSFSTKKTQQPGEWAWKTDLPLEQSWAKHCWSPAPAEGKKKKKKAHASCRIEADEHWKEPQIHTLIQWLVRKPPAFWSLTHVFRHFCFYIKWSGLSRSQKGKLSSMAWAFIKDKDERCLWQREHMAGTSSAGGVWVQRGKLLLAPGGMAF